MKKQTNQNEPKRKDLGRPTESDKNRVQFNQLMSEKHKIKEIGRPPKEKEDEDQSMSEENKTKESGKYPKEKEEED